MWTDVLYCHKGNRKKKYEKKYTHCDVNKHRVMSRGKSRVTKRYVPDTYVQLSGRCDRAYNMLRNYFTRIRWNAFDGLQKFWEFSQPHVQTAEKKKNNNFHTLAVNWWSSTTKTLLKYILFLEPSKLVKCHVSIHVHTCRCGWAVSSA